MFGHEVADHGRAGDGHLQGSQLQAFDHFALAAQGAAGEVLHLEAAGCPESLESLPEHACIGYAHLSAGQVWRFKASRGQGERSVRVQSRFVANNAELMRGAAVAGLGLLMVPQFIVADSLRRGELVALLPEFPPVGKTLHALYPRDRQGSARIRALVEHLAAGLQPVPLWERKPENKIVS